MVSITRSINQNLELSNIFSFVPSVTEIDLFIYFDQAVRFFSSIEPKYKVSESKWNNVQHILFLVGFVATVTGLTRIIFVGLREYNQGKREAAESLRAKENEIKDLNEQAANLRRELVGAKREATKSLGDKQAEVVDLRQQVENLETKVANADRTAAEALRAKESETSDLHKQVKEARKELTSAERKAETSLRAKETENRNLLQQIGKLKSELTSAKRKEETSLRAKERENRNLLQQIRELERRQISANRKSEKSLANKENEIISLRQQNQELGTKLANEKRKAEKGLRAKKAEAESKALFNEPKLEQSLSHTNLRNELGKRNVLLQETGYRYIFHSHLTKSGKKGISRETLVAEKNKYTKRPKVLDDFYYHKINDFYNEKLKSLDLIETDKIDMYKFRELHQFIFELKEWVQQERLKLADAENNNKDFCDLISHIEVYNKDLDQLSAEDNRIETTSLLRKYIDRETRIRKIFDLLNKCDLLLQKAKKEEGLPKQTHVLDVQFGDALIGGEQDSSYIISI